MIKPINIIMLNLTKIPVKKPNEYSILGYADFHLLIITEITCVKLACSHLVAIFLFLVVLFGDAFPSGIIRQHANYKPKCQKFIPPDPLLLLTN